MSETAAEEERGPLMEFLDLCDEMDATPYDADREVWDRLWARQDELVARMTPGELAIARKRTDD